MASRTTILALLAGVLACKGPQDATLGVAAGPPVTLVSSSQGVPRAPQVWAFVAIGARGGLAVGPAPADRERGIWIARPLSGPADLPDMLAPRPSAPEPEPALDDGPEEDTGGTGMLVNLDEAQ